MPNKEWIGVIEYASRKNQSRQHIYNLIATGKIPKKKIKITKKVIKVIKILWSETNK